MYPRSQWDETDWIDTTLRTLRLLAILFLPSLIYLAAPVIHWILAAWAGEPGPPCGPPYDCD